MSAWYQYIQTKETQKTPHKRDLSKIPKFKTVLLGDSGVGKTTIAKRFNHQPIRDDGSTIGCSFLTHLYTDDSTNPPTEFRVDMWDTAGQERYFSLVDIYLKDCDIILLVYDIHRPHTLQAIFDRWLPQLLNSRYHRDIDFTQSTKERQKIIFLIGNKADTEAEEIILELLRVNQYLIKNYHIEHVQFSALNGRNFQEFLDKLYGQLIGNFLPVYPQRVKERQQTIETEPKRRRFRGCCGS